jgi:hypothetical protein
MVKCQPDISPAVVKLSQYLENPAEEHYIAAKHLASIHLANTVNKGIYYWRKQPFHALPEGKLPSLHPDNHTIQRDTSSFADAIAGYADSDWATDTKKRHSVTGSIIMLAGGAIAFKSKFQETIALSSTKAEFVAACDATKMILFYRSILEDSGIPQNQASTLFEGNNGALMIANAQQPTKGTCRIDIKYFSILDWV